MSNCLYFFDGRTASAENEKDNGSSAVWLTNQVSGSATVDTYYNLEARWLDADNTKAFNLKGIVDGSSKLLAEDSEYTSRSYLGLASWWTGEWRIDRVYVRKCLAVEPAAEISGTFEKPANTASTPTTLTTTFEYDDYNKLTEITFPDSTTETLSYDDNGQLVKSEKSSGETTAYQWNDQGMLVKVILPTGEPVEYEYDGNQRLISRKSSDGVDNFVQSGWDIMTKTDDLGKRTYYTGSSAIEDRESVKYFHYNHRGDTVLVTDADGEIIHNLNYEAYGKPTNNEGIPINTLSLTNATDPNNNTYSTGNTSGGSGNNLPNLYVGASGIRYDTKTNLHYMRFRWFSGEQMRFISPDLLMDLNRYAYVSGNPLNRIDPMGLADWGFMPAEKRRKEIETIGRDMTIIKRGLINDTLNLTKTWELIGPYGSSDPELWMPSYVHIFDMRFWNDLIQIENEMGVAPALEISTPVGGVQIVRNNYNYDIFVYPNFGKGWIQGKLKPGINIGCSYIFNYSKEKYKGHFVNAQIAAGGGYFNLFTGPNLNKDPKGFGFGLSFPRGFDFDISYQYFWEREDLIRFKNQIENMIREYSGWFTEYEYFYY